MGSHHVARSKALSTAAVLESQGEVVVAVVDVDDDTIDLVTESAYAEPRPTPADLSELQSTRKPRKKKAASGSAD